MCDMYLTGFPTYSFRHTSYFHKKSSIDTSYIDGKVKRMKTFSNRWSKLFKKANELEILTGSNIFITVESKAGKTCVIANKDEMYRQYRTKELKPNSKTKHETGETATLKGKVGNMLVQVILDSVKNSIVKLFSFS